MKHRHFIWTFDRREMTSGLERPLDASDEESHLTTKSQKSAKEEAPREKRLPAHSKEESPLRSKEAGTSN